MRKAQVIANLGYPHIVELPGLEPGSFVVSPGLLRAQFAHDPYSALLLARTRLGRWAQPSVSVPTGPDDSARRQAL